MDDSGLSIWTSAGKTIIKKEVSKKARYEVYKVNGSKIIDTHLAGGELNTIDLPAAQMVCR